MVRGHHAPSQQAHAGGCQFTDKIFSQHCQAFLHFVITGQPGSQQAQRLLAGIPVGQHVRAHLVLDQSIQPVGRKPGVRGHQQLAIRDHQAGHLVGQDDLRLNLRITLLHASYLLLGTIGIFSSGQPAKRQVIPGVPRQGVKNGLGCAQQLGLHRFKELKAAIEIIARAAFH